MIKQIIFDFDGTLADSRQMVLRILNQLSAKHQYRKINTEDLEHLRKLSMKERCNYLSFPLYKVPFLVSDVYKYYRKALHELGFFEGIPELLSELKARGYELAIISSNSEKNIRHFLGRQGITHIEKVVCSGKLFGKEKLIRRFLKAEKLHTSAVLYVGDEQRDIEACKKSGIPIISVSWGYDEAAALKQASPDFFAHHPQEILQILQQI